MNRNVKILPYKNGSVSANALAEALGCKQIRLRGSTVHSMRPKQIINWGNSGRNLPPQGLGTQHTVFNDLGCVEVAANKLHALLALDNAGVRIPAYTTSMEEAVEWSNAGHIVVERHKLTGNSGEGIRLVGRDHEAGITEAPLYTRYVKKTDEYRIHVMKGVVIDMQRKARRLETPDEEVNWQVRNLAGGFIFARQEVNPPQDVIDQAVAAVAALNLDFGAVDVVFNYRNNAATVLEVNTACGLEGTTLERYVAAFTKLLAGEDPASVTQFPEQPQEEVQEAIAVSAERSKGILEALAEQETSLRPIQAGDRVRIIAQSHGWAGVQAGDLGVVKTVRDLVVDVATAAYHHDMTWTCTPDCLELVEENNSEPSPSPVVQPTTGNKFLVVVDGMCFVENGVFDSREEAQADIDSGFHYNLKQMNPDKTFEVKEV